MDKHNIKLNVILYANRGLAYSKKSEHSNAIKDFDRSIELDNRYFKAYLRRGDSKSAQGDFDSACADYQKVMELDPTQNLR